ncbi:alanine--glyoxylate aminotransferase family protein [Pseudomonas cichorii]|uniref:pyridoxal-phosphate-dependent aminotransferase family protein n=1 Tax=Pseudomonas cichorii TaxID=36746 RepID=UPI0018E5C99A|nr:alanine--glyoxylate aminotransferase family protein [Pseudomonas cichorii]MBI6853477.1 alanine--glyoxylate aminotransferase family protein [Pseudomonas cichorii]
MHYKTLQHQPNGLSLPPMHEINLRITGPTPLAPSVREAMSQQMVSHRSDEFKSMYAAVDRDVRALLGTRHPALFMTCSGTGGLEAAVQNVLQPGDKVLSLHTGFYGELFAQITERWLQASEQLIRLQSPPGESVDFHLLTQLLQHQHFDAVLITHNESSTGVLNPLEDLVRIVKAHSDALILCDAISSAGTTPIQMDRWGVDVLITVPQKGLMAPPGLAIVIANDRAQERSINKRVSLYFDFQRALSSARQYQTPSTPSISVFRGLQASLQLLFVEGLDKVYERHAQARTLCQNALMEMELDSFAKAPFQSPGVTAISLPEHINAQSLQLALEQNYNLFTTPAAGHWQNKVLRLAHMGWFSVEDIDRALSCLKDHMRKIH